MSDSSTSDDLGTPPYPTPHLGSGASSQLHASVENVNFPRFYSMGSFQLASSQRASPVLPQPTDDPLYMYAQPRHGSSSSVGIGNDMDSNLAEDAERSTFNPIELNMQASINGGYSIESAGLLPLRSTSENPTPTLLPILSAGADRSFVSSPLTSPDQSLPHSAQATPSTVPPVQPPYVITATAPLMAGETTNSLHSSLSSLHPNETLVSPPAFPAMPSAMPSSYGESPPDPSITANARTPTRSTIYSLDGSRLPQLPTPNSMIRTALLMSPMADSTRGGGNSSGFLPAPPTLRTPLSDEKKSSVVLVPRRPPYTPLIVANEKSTSTSKSSSIMEKEEEQTVPAVGNTIPAQPAALDVVVAPPFVSEKTHQKSTTSSTSSAPESKDAREIPPYPHQANSLAAFTPIIQQRRYRKTDIKRIANTGEYTFENISDLPVAVKPLRHTLLARVEPSVVLRKRALHAGRVKPLQGRPTHTSLNNCSPEGHVGRRESPREVDVYDFLDTNLVFENVLLALCFSLWGTLAHYNGVVQGILSYAAPPIPASAPPSRRVPTKMKMPLDTILRWLNEHGVDVLILSHNRNCASSFCAKRRQISRQNPSALAPSLSGTTAGFHTGAEVDAAAVPPASTQPVTEDATSGMPEADPKGKQQKTVEVKGSHLHKRVLVALSFDRRHHLWCPLTTSLPIREIAQKRHETRRQIRAYQRRQQRQVEKLAAKEAAKKREMEDMAEKLKAWQQRNTDIAAGISLPALPFSGQQAAMQATDPLPLVPAQPSSDDITESRKDPSTPSKPASRLPFAGISYPNLVQTDVGFLLMLRQGTHQMLWPTRIRLFVALPLSLIAVGFGIALLVYFRAAAAVCLYDNTNESCVETVNSSASGSQYSDVDCSEWLSPSLYSSSLVWRFLFSSAVSVGNAIVVSICTVFVALLDGVLMVFFAIRFLALGGVRPCFFHVLHVLQLILGAIACAFSAYAISVFRVRRHTVTCSMMSSIDSALCSARTAQCGGNYTYYAFLPSNEPNTALILAVIFLAMCALSWFISFLPLLPATRVQDDIPIAVPDTYAFQPSFFAPDGPSPNEVERLRSALQQPMRLELQRHVKERDRLLTATTTIGEMMDASRLKSLQQIKRNVARHRRMAASENQSRQKKKVREHYLVVSDGVESSRSSSTDSSIVLAPRLMQRVDEISRRVDSRRCSARSSGITKESSDGSPFSSEVASPSAVWRPGTPPHAAAPRQSRSLRVPSSSDDAVVTIQLPHDDCGDDTATVTTNGTPTSAEGVGSNPFLRSPSFVIEGARDGITDPLKGGWRPPTQPKRDSRRLYRKSTRGISPSVNIGISRIVQRLEQATGSGSPHCSETLPINSDDHTLSRYSDGPESSELHQ